MATAVTSRMSVTKRPLIDKIRGQAPMLAVLVVLAVGVLYLLIVPDRWRRGAAVISLALLLAGVLRAILPPMSAGWLRVRNRKLDTVIYLVLGIAILVADIRVPS